MKDITLLEDYPAKIAQLLLDGSIDVGLVPVAIIPKLQESHIITDFCIGADGPVASVCLFSEVPMEAITAVYLDYQSRTSVMLAWILLKEYWKSNAELIVTGGEEYRTKITGSIAGLVIGDRAFEQRLQSTFIYDLGEAWQAHTGLPFVFAAWVSNKELPEDFLQRFNEANALGLQTLDAVVEENHLSTFSLYDYYTKYIDYHLDDVKRKAIALFHEKLRHLPA